MDNTDISNSLADLFKLIDNVEHENIDLDILLLAERLKKP